MYFSHNTTRYPVMSTKTHESKYGHVNVLLAMDASGSDNKRIQDSTLQTLPPVVRLLSLTYFLFRPFLYLCFFLPFSPRFPICYLRPFF